MRLVGESRLESIRRYRQSFRLRFQERLPRSLRECYCSILLNLRYVFRPYVLASNVILAKIMKIFYSGVEAYQTINVSCSFLRTALPLASRMLLFNSPRSA